MYGFFIFMHAVVCALLLTIILMQSGRGGGLTESFSSAESMFGAKTNVVLIKTTTVLACLFLITCLSLAFLSTKKTKSLIAQGAVSQQDQASDVAEEGSSSSLSVDTNQSKENADKTLPESQQGPIPSEPRDIK